MKTDKEVSQEPIKEEYRNYRFLTSPGLELRTCEKRENPCNYGNYHIRLTNLIAGIRLFTSTHEIRVRRRDLRCVRYVDGSKALKHDTVEPIRPYTKGY